MHERLIEIKELLEAKQYPVLKVGNFTATLRQMSVEKKKGQPAYPWLFKLPAVAYVEAFDRVYSQGLEIDNKTVFLGYRGKLVITYGYQAYKNRLLLSYPESTVDVQLVKKADKFMVSKQSGTVVYSHEFGSPFASEKENPIVGAYCVIRNKRGEFVELLSDEDIKKIRATAETQTIWTKWYSEMVKKSVLKRACKLHFFDLVEEIDSIDNEGQDPERVSVDAELQAKIEEASTLEELTAVYEAGKNEAEDVQEFLRLLGERRAEIEEDQKQTA